MCTRKKLLAKIMECYECRQSLSQHFDNGMVSKLVTHRDEQLRSGTAKALAYDENNPKAVDLLSVLAVDPDASVRVEAVDSLGSFPVPQSYEVLKRALSDSDLLVRAYAAYSLASVGCELCPEDAKKTLLDHLCRETSNRVCVDIYGGLYILGDASALERLLEQYQTDDYLVKCAVLNMLNYNLNDRNVSRIKAFLTSLDPEAEPRAVQCTIRALMEECDALRRGISQ